MNFMRHASFFVANSKCDDENQIAYWHKHSSFGRGIDQLLRVVHNWMFNSFSMSQKSFLTAGVTSV